MKIIFNLQNDISLLDKRGDSLKGLRDEFAVQAIGVSFVFIYLFTFICLIMNLVIDVYLFYRNVIALFSLQALTIKDPITNENKIKETYILVAVIVLLALILGILIYFYIVSNTRLVYILIILIP